VADAARIGRRTNPLGECACRSGGRAGSTGRRSGPKPCSSPRRREAQSGSCRERENLSPRCKGRRPRTAGMPIEPGQMDAIPLRFVAGFEGWAAVLAIASWPNPYRCGSSIWSIRRALWQGRCYCGSRNPQRSCPGRIGGGRVARSRLCDGGRESASSAVWRHSAWVDCSSDRRSWLVLAIWREGAEPAEANLVGLTRKNSFVRTASYDTKSW
jgi:hypothetical protein